MMTLGQRIGPRTRLETFLIGESPHIEETRRFVKDAAPTSDPVLVLGETGTGKGVVARAIHDESGRHGTFVAVNCPTIAGELFESQLFGHRRGAFTGAVDDHDGFFHVADGGTIFLDEIGELSPAMQAKLLRVLEEDGNYRRVGETKERKTTARIIAATNVDVEKAMNHGTLRPDLFWRLEVFKHKVAPLRERAVDVPPLTGYFLEKRAGHNKSFSDEAVAAMTSYHWPGNVRQLENVVRKAAIYSRISEGRIREGVIDIEHVKPHLIAKGQTTSNEEKFPGTTPASETLTFAQMELEYWKHMLVEKGGDVSKTARAADVPRTYLYKRFKKHPELNALLNSLRTSR